MYSVGLFENTKIKRKIVEQKVRSKDFFPDFFILRSRLKKKNPNHNL